MKVICFYSYMQLLNQVTTYIYLTMLVYVGMCLVSLHAYLGSKVCYIHCIYILGKAFILFIMHSIHSIFIAYILFIMKPKLDNVTKPSQKLVLTTYLPSLSTQLLYFRLGLVANLSLVANVIISLITTHLFSRLMITEINTYMQRQESK